MLFPELLLSQLFFLHFFTVFFFYTRISSVFVMRNFLLLIHFAPASLSLFKISHYFYIPSEFLSSPFLLRTTFFFFCDHFLYFVFYIFPSLQYVFCQIEVRFVLPYFSSWLSAFFLFFCFKLSIPFFLSFYISSHITPLYFSLFISLFLFYYIFHPIYAILSSFILCLSSVAFASLFFLFFFFLYSFFFLLLLFPLFDPYIFYYINILYFYWLFFLFDVFFCYFFLQSYFLLFNVSFTLLG